MKHRIGVDIGGTFTDCVVIDENGKINTFKESSTPEDRLGFIMLSTKRPSILVRAWKIFWAKLKFLHMALLLLPILY